MALGMGVDDDVAVDEALAGPVVQIDAHRDLRVPVARVRDEVVADEMPRRFVFNRRLVPAVNGAVVRSNLARTADSVVFNEIAAVAAVAQVDPVVRQIVNLIMGHTIPVAQAEEHSGRVSIIEPAVVNNIVSDLVVHRMGRTQCAAGALINAVPPAGQNDPVGARMADFVVPDQVPLIVVAQVDAIASDDGDRVVLDAAVGAHIHVDRLAAIVPSHLRAHGANPVHIRIMGRWLTGAGFREDEARYPNVLRATHVKKTLHHRHCHLHIFDGILQRPEIEDAVFTIEAPLARPVELFKDIFDDELAALRMADLFREEDGIEVERSRAVGQSDDPFVLFNGLDSDDAGISPQWLSGH